MEPKRKDPLGGERLIIELMDPFYDVLLDKTFRVLAVEVKTVEEEVSGYYIDETEVE